ncbi:MAG: zinc metalloprotease HtpX [Gemmatimonadetes bacterium]|nr:zinc metalloprotease HtpX [Gemmatimonadota bacterium]MCK5482319.1 zinc metalloprotease HtpX [Gemmatimonadota bacterium]
MSYIKTFGLMALMTALFVAIAGWFGGRSAMIIALGFAAVFNFGAYWFSDRAVLRMYRARPLERHEAPGLYDMVDDLRQRAGLPMPAVAISASHQPNAFATGRDPAHAVVCVTQGMLQVASADELAGVLGHELAHIKNRDMLIGTVAATLAAAVVMLARLGFWFGGDDNRGGAIGGLMMLILAPVAAMLIQMAISRAGEYRADRIGAEISGQPHALASALKKLEAEARRRPMDLNPSAAHLAIVNPLRAGGLSGLFRTHPPTEERVRRLEEIARRGV